MGVSFGVCLEFFVCCGTLTVKVCAWLALVLGCPQVGQRPFVLALSRRFLFRVRMAWSCVFLSW